MSSCAPDCRHSLLHSSSSPELKVLKGAFSEPDDGRKLFIKPACLPDAIDRNG